MSAQPNPHPNPPVSFLFKAKSLARRAFSWLSPGDRYALIVAVSFKVVLLMTGTLSFIAFQNHYPDGVGLWPYLSVWNRWDAHAYLSISEQGYTLKDPQYLAFFPLFPFLTRLARPLVFQDTLSAAFAVSTIASLFAAVLFYRLARLDLKPRAAERAVWFLFAFPSAYFLHIGYTEAVFSAFTFGAMYAAKKGRWAGAGVLGALAAATRVNGLLLLAFFAVEAIQEWREKRRFPRRCLFALLTPIGAGVYLYLNYRLTGDPLAFLHYQREHWHHNLAPPWVGIANARGYAGYAAPADATMVGGAEVVAALLGFGIGFYALWRRQFAYGVWTLLNVVLWTSNDFLMSGPRYMLIAVPLFLLLGRVSSKRMVWAAVTALFLLLQGLFATIFSNGRWAF